MKAKSAAFRSCPLNRSLDLSRVMRMEIINVGHLTPDSYDANIQDNESCEMPRGLSHRQILYVRGKHEERHNVVEVRRLRARHVSSHAAATGSETASDQVVDVSADYAPDRFETNA